MMKSHVFRPLYVVIALVAAILFARAVVVPSDFGIHERGYMFGWHRKANEEEWKVLETKFKGGDYCAGCHMDKSGMHAESPHAQIQCENCHGPAVGHPEAPERLAIDKSRALCLRCHSKLPYNASDRSLIPGIDPDKHNPQEECSLCHDPHDSAGGA